MKCFHPIDVSVRSGGDVVSVFSQHRRLKSVYQGRGSFLVPCGKCLACKSRRKSEMVFRMDCERRYGHFGKNGDLRRFKHCFFVTLTYAPEFLPRYVPTVFDRRTGEVFESVEVGSDHTGLLNPAHLVDFMKRLRRYYSLDCKMFACGEYGDDYTRPHYHLILYLDADWQTTVNMVRRAWSMRCPKDKVCSPGSFSVKDGKYNVRRYSFGRIHVKPVNIRRMRYCAKYVCKDTDTPHPIKKFARVSKGLGLGWLLSSEACATRSHKRLFAYTSDSKRACIGRYFTHRIFTKDELTECVDVFIDEFESPPPGCEFGEAYKRWYLEHLMRDKAMYRQTLANHYLPRLSYV